MFEMDLDELLMSKIKAKGGNEDDFKRLDLLISEYSKRSGMPEDGVALIIIDCVDGGFSKEDVEKQLRVYDTKRSGSLIA